VTRLDDALRGPFRRAFYVLAGAVLCILVIACVNLSNLLLGRINERRQEFRRPRRAGARTRHLVDRHSRRACCSQRRGP
jgi:hypothetical protein